MISKKTLTLFILVILFTACSSTTNKEYLTKDDVNYLSTENKDVKSTNQMELLDESDKIAEASN